MPASNMAAPTGSTPPLPPCSAVTLTTLTSFMSTDDQLTLAELLTTIFWWADSWWNIQHSLGAARKFATNFGWTAFLSTQAIFAHDFVFPVGYHTLHQPHDLLNAVSRAQIWPDTGQRRSTWTTLTSWLNMPVQSCVGRWQVHHRKQRSILRWPTGTSVVLQIPRLEHNYTFWLNCQFMQLKPRLCNDITASSTNWCRGPFKQWRSTSTVSNRCDESERCGLGTYHSSLYEFRSLGHK